MYVYILESVLGLVALDPYIVGLVNLRKWRSTRHVTIPIAPWNGLEKFFF
jgi:hypothetical protein